MKVLVAQLSDSLQPHRLSLPGCSVHGILQARIPEWVVFPSPGDLSDPGIEPRSSALQADSLPSESPGKLVAKSLIFCLIKYFSFALDR